MPSARRQLRHLGCRRRHTPSLFRCCPISCRPLGRHPMFISQVRGRPPALQPRLGRMRPQPPLMRQPALVRQPRCIQPMRPQPALPSQPRLVCPMHRISMPHHRPMRHAPPGQRPPHRTLLRPSRNARHPMRRCHPMPSSLGRKHNTVNSPAARSRSRAKCRQRQPKSQQWNHPVLQHCIFARRVVSHF